MRILGPLFVACVLALVPAFVPRDAEACPNVTVPVFNESVRKTKDANAALDRGDFATAKKTIKPVLMLSHVNGAIVMAGNKGWKEVAPIYRRAVRIDALATSRDPSSDEAARTTALHAFEDRVLNEAGDSPDPTLLADHAEMESRVSTRTAPALMMLRTLRDKDLLGSAHAMAALARLEKGAGNADAEKDAREKCRKAAVKKSICEE